MIFKLKIMKVLTIILFGALMISVNSFGQRYTFKSNMSVFNPSLTGLTDDHFGQLNYSGTHLKNNLDNWSNTLSGIYNIDVAKFNSGFGVNFNLNEVSNSRDVGVNYRYKIKLKENLDIAFGTALNYSQYSSDLFPTKHNALSLNLGTAVQWKGLNVGMSVMNFKNEGYESPNDISTTENEVNRKYYAHVWYDLEISNKFTLAPSIVYSYDRGFQNLELALRGDHFNKFWWSLGYHSRDRYQVGAGIILFDDFFLGYNAGVIRSRLQRASHSLTHSFNLTYRINRY